VRTLADELRLAVVTNDIYTTEDADFLLRNGVLPAERIRAVETGCCPHTRSATTSQQTWTRRGPGGAPRPAGPGTRGERRDNLTATFSRGLVDRQIFVWTLPAATRCAQGRPG